jgi:hypothetical protein
MVKKGMTKKKGIAWTLDKEIAVWFAKRFDTAGCNGATVYEGTINKSDVFMYTNQRSEKECVLNPSKIKNLKTLII